MIGGKTKRPLFKAISLFVVFAFSLSNVSFAVPEKNIGVGEPAEVKSVLSADEIGVAIDCGTIKSKYTGKNGKTIIHIQDAHCNYEAQSNITRILEQLSKECGIDMISVEGAEGIVDTAWFKAFPDSEIRKEVATYFMKKGEITGAEFFSINSDYNGTIFGAETRDYYVKNLKAFTKVYPYKDSIENYFKNTRTIANRLKGIIYPAKLKEVDLKIRGFEAKEVELSDFADYLNKTAARYKVDIKDCGNFKKLTDTLEYERKIDFDIVDQERSDYIDLLSKKLSKEKMTELVTQSIRFKKGHIEAVDFYTYLRDQAKEYDIAIVQEYPNLFYYYIYTKLYDGIDNEGLFREIDKVEARIKDKLFTDDTQRKLDKHSAMLDMFINLVNIELTNEDYDLFKEYNREFTLEDVVEFIAQLSARYNLNYSIDSVPVQISENIPSMIDFYEIAIKRDNALIDNTLRQMKKEGKDRCVFIAGGFHTRGVKHLLEKKGISYVVVTPKITKDVETPYIKVLTNQRTSLEDIITESAAMPGMGAASSTEDVAQPRGEMLAPLHRVALVTELIDVEGVDKEKLDKLSDDIGTVDGGMTVKQVAENFFERVVKECTDRWLTKVKEKLLVDEFEGDTARAAAEWQKFMTEDVFKKMILGTYLDKVRVGLKLVLEAKQRIAQLDAIFQPISTRVVNNFWARFKEEGEKLQGGTPADGSQGPAGDEKSPGSQDAEGKYQNIDDARAADNIIEKSVKAGTYTKEKVAGDGIRENFKFMAHEGFAEALIRAGLNVNIHPGRGGKFKRGERKDKTRGLLQAHIDKDVYEALRKADKGYLETVARHECAHLDIYNVQALVDEGLNPDEDGGYIRILARLRDEYGYSGYLGVEAESAVKTWEKWSKYLRKAERAKRAPLAELEIYNLQEEFVNGLKGCEVHRGIKRTMNEAIRAKREKVEKEKREAAKISKANLEEHAKRMSEATSSHEGPKLAIVVNSSLAQADFWQDRFTAEDNWQGSGEVIRDDAIVISVTETNWNGGAGNGLGTLNGLVQAARKAWAEDLYGFLGKDVKIDVDESKKDPNARLSKTDIKKLVKPFLEEFFTDGDSVLMCHTAGKGTRTAPLPGVEVNTKSNIKLSEMVRVKGKLEPITVLESVIKQMSIYSRTRGGRMCVAWGDQVIINENSVDVEPTHHVEIFGMAAPIDEEIEQYGILIPGKEEGDALQREKLKVKQIREIPGVGDTVCKSMGFFSITREFLSEMILDDKHGGYLEELAAAGWKEDVDASLNTDPDWWQPLTSDRKEYEKMMAQKGVSKDKARAQWDRMHKLWDNFNKGDLSDHCLGVTDTGENALWWDYGQNKFFLSNLHLLTDARSHEARVARQFFGIEELATQEYGKDNWMDKNSIHSMTVKPKPAKPIKNSIVLGSRVKNARLENCIVINSDLENVTAKNAIIIGSTVLELNAWNEKPSLCYNVVQEKVNLKDGQILANIFHPELGRIEMRTDASRDGSADWKGGEFVYDNLFAYADIADAIKASSVTVEQAEELKSKAETLLKSGKAQDLSPPDHKKLEMLLRRRNEKEHTLLSKAKELLEKAESLPGSKKNEIAELEKEAAMLRLQAYKAHVAVSEARQIIAYRMLKFGDVEKWRANEYLRAFAPAFDGASDLGFKTGSERKEKQAEAVDEIEYLNWVLETEGKYGSVQDYLFEKFPPLRFGTSGLRDLVKNMTDMEIYTNVCGFLNFLIERKMLKHGDEVSIGSDFRSSSPRIRAAVAEAIRSMGMTVDDQRFVSSPALANHAMNERVVITSSIVVTGSHIPDDRNGMKPYKTTGEVMKGADEEDILRNIEDMRKHVYSIDPFSSLFDYRTGMFKPHYAKRAQKLLKTEEEARKECEEYLDKQDISDENKGRMLDMEDSPSVASLEYILRYERGFPPKALEGVEVFEYQHSAVGRDVIKTIFEILGADVKVGEPGEKVDITYINEEGEEVREAAPLRSKKFVPVDTENVSAKTMAIMERKLYDLDIDIGISADGDTDRPLLVYRVYDKNGEKVINKETGLQRVDFVPGDLLGLLAVIALKDLGVDVNAAALSVSANEKIKEALTGLGIEWEEVKIGSPWCIEQMDEFLKPQEHRGWNVLSWETNGGFLTGTDIQIPGASQPLEKLATRDAVVSMALVMMYVKKHGKQGHLKRISDWINEVQGVNPNWTSASKMVLEMEKGLAIRDSISPAPETQVKEVEFISYDEIKVTYLKGAKKKPETITEEELFQELVKIREMLQEALNKSGIEGYITRINYLDGVKIFLDTGEITHFRPSGNEPAFRNYAQAKTPERARELWKIGFSKVVPELVRMTSTQAESQLVTPGVQAAMAPTPQADMTPIERAERSALCQSLPPEEQELFMQSIAALDNIIDRGDKITMRPAFRLGIDGYTWGERVVGDDGKIASILATMGVTTSEKAVDKVRESLSPEQLHKYFERYVETISDVELLGRSIAGIGMDERFESWLREYIEKEEVIGERWFAAGLIDVGTGYVLPAEVLSFWPEEVYGRAHVTQFGPESGITAKHLTSAVSLSLQYHRFPEMIVALEDSWAYLGLNEKEFTKWCKVTGLSAKDAFKKALKLGHMDIFNKVELKAGQTYVVPAGMPHAYDKVKVYEVKAVNATQDKAGTFSFYDRLKWYSPGFDAAKAKEAREIFEKELAPALEANDIEKVNDIVQRMIDRKLIRDGKDVLTLPEERTEDMAADQRVVNEIVNEIEEYGFLQPINPEYFMYTPLTIEGQEHVQKVGEAQGFEAVKYTIPEGETKEAYEPLKGRQHTLFVAEGNVMVTFKKKGTSKAPGHERSLSVKKGEELAVYSNMGETYTIHALKEGGEAVVYTQFKPFPKEERSILIDAEKAEEIPGTGEREFDITVAYKDYGPGMTSGVDDQIKLRNEKIKISDVLPVIGEREFTILVKGGRCEFGGNEFAAGDMIPVTRDTQEYKLIMERTDEPFIVRTSAEPLVIEVQYRKTSEERIAYAAHDAVMKNQTAIRAAGKINVLMPKGMFVSGANDRKSVGTCEWYEAQFREALLTDNITIRAYGGDSLEEAYRMYREEGTTNILYASRKDLKDFKQATRGIRKEGTPEAKKKAEKRDDFISRVRIRELSERIVKGRAFVEGHGLSHTREAIAEGLLQAAVEPEMLLNVQEHSILQDIINVFDQNGIKGVAKEQYLLCALISFAEYKGIRNELPEDIKDMIAAGKTPTFDQFLKLIHRILWDHPAKPFDPQSEFEKRRQTLWAA